MKEKKDFRRICKVCDCPQFPSPSGFVCRNGHGGADWYPGEVKDYVVQYRTWFSEILAEIRRSSNRA